MNRIFKISVIALLLAVPFLFQCAYYNTLFNAKHTYQEGIKYLQKDAGKTRPAGNQQANKYFEQTIEKCWKLIEIYGDKSKYADDALLYIVKSEYNLNKLAQAKLHIKQFLSKYDRSDLVPEAYLWYGKILIKNKDSKTGVEYLYRAINSARRNEIKAQAYYELGSLSFGDKDYQKAVEFFEKALKENVSDEYKAFIQFYLGESYFAQKKYKEAIKRYKKVEKFSPSIDIEYRTKFNLAKAYSEIGKYKEALKILRKMLTAPRFKNFAPLIKAETAHIYQLQGRLTDAVDLYKEIVRERVSNPGTAQASFNLAKLYEGQLANVDSAVYYYDRVRKSYAKYDSVETAEARKKFLAKLKEIKDNIKYERRLVFRLEHDKFFRDSLYKAQLEDSIMREIRKMQGLPAVIDTSDTSRQQSDSLNPHLSYQDSLQKALRDSILKLQQDSIKNAGSGAPPKQQNPSSSKKKKETKKKRPLEKRKLPEIKEDLKKNEYHLAEFFLLENNQLDSALVHYEKFLKAYQDTTLIPKALYSLYFIFSQPGFQDSTRRDSIEQILLRDYPQSPFTYEILKREGLVKDSAATDSLYELGHRLFREAEKLHDAGLIDSSLQVYKKVAGLDTNLIWSAKAQYARAWIFEHELQNIDSALAAYRYLKDHYPEKEFVQIAEKKIAPPPKEEVASPVLAAMDTSKTEAVVDSITRTTIAQLTSSDTSSVVATPGDLPFVAKTERYRKWRMRRSRSQNNP